MTPEERTSAVTNAAQRIVKNLEVMNSDAKQAYIKKLINMLDDQHLLFLDFAVEMTPNAVPAISEDEVKQTVRALLEELPTSYPPYIFFGSVNGYYLEIERTILFHGATAEDAIKHTKYYVEVRKGSPTLSIGVICLQLRESAGLS